MVPALVAPLAKGAASLVGWESAKRALGGIAPKAKGLVDDLTGWIGRNPASAAKGGGILGGIGVGGWSISSALSSVGIDDNQLQLVVTGGLVLGGIAAIGQLVDWQIGGGGS